MATLQQYTTTYLMNALYTNPTATTFPWENGFSRTQILTELSNRSGQGDSSQIVSNLPLVGTTDGNSTVNDKRHIK
jgi:hypothetical protein